MIILGIVFVFCIYVAAFAKKFFNLRDETMVSVCMWTFLFSMCGLFTLMSLPTH